MTEPYILLQYLYSDYEISVWAFPDEGRIRVYMNQYIFDTLPYVEELPKFNEV